MMGVYLTALTLNGIVAFAFLRHLGVHVRLALVGGVFLILAPQIWMAIYWTNLNLLGWSAHAHYDRVGLSESVDGKKCGYGLLCWLSAFGA